MQKTISINNTDVSSYFTQYGYKTSYKKIQGKAGGTMLDGSTTEDVIAVKAVISLSFIPLSEEALNSFLQMLYSMPYASVAYYDVMSGEERHIEAIYSMGAVSHISGGLDDLNLWLASTLTLTER